MITKTIPIRNGRSDEKYKLLWSKYNTDNLPNLSLRVARVILLLLGGGREVAQLGLVLILDLQLQLSRVAVLVAKSLRSNVGNLFSPSPSLAGSSLRRPPCLRPWSCPASPRPYPLHPPGCGQLPNQNHRLQYTWPSRWVVKGSLPGVTGSTSTSRLKSTFSPSFSSISSFTWT